MRTGTCGAGPQYGVLDRGLQVHLEGVAELIGLGLAQQVAVGASGVHAVAADAVLLEVREDFLEGLLSDAPDAPGRQLGLVAAGDISRLFQQLAQVVQFVPDTAGVLAQQFGQLLRVNLAEVAGADGFLERGLELVELLEVAHHLHRLFHGQAVVAEEGILAPHILHGHQLLHEVGELGHFALGFRVEGLGQGVLHLAASFGGHTFQH